MTLGRLLDNRTRRLADYLRPNLASARDLRLVSAYFSIYGFELLADVLEPLPRVRFLFGDPDSVADVDPGRKGARSFKLTETGLDPTQALRQKALARRCEQWILRESVAVRSMRRSGFLHGKMYLADGEDIRGAAVVGSSNFTRGGLGGGQRPNIEINLAVPDEETRNELREWFDRLWPDEGLTDDVKDEVIRALRRLGDEYAPEFLYFKTLFELFRKDIEARLADDQRIEAVNLAETQIWNTLYGFQRDGARTIIQRLQRNGGCILADSVGLGKTYTALAVIKYFELRNERVLVLCPRKLRENWALYPAHLGRTHNPFEKDRFGYTLLSHTDLSRHRGDAFGVDLTDFKWSNFDLVVIDESHSFRNARSQRYGELMKSIAEGVQTKVLLLSATPVNTSLADLRNQIQLMAGGRNDAFAESADIQDIGIVLNQAQKKFREWEQDSTDRDKAVLLESLGADFLRLLDAVSIARSRRQIEKFYAREMDQIGQFPTHAPPENCYPPTDLAGQLSYQDLAARIGQFRLSVYRPSDYLTDPERQAALEDERKRLNFNQKDREHWLVGMIRVNFLKRLESSAHSLTLTLDRTIAKIEDLIGRIHRFEEDHVDASLEDSQPDEDPEDEDLWVNRARHPYRLSELDLPRWKVDLEHDRDTLTAARDQVGQVGAERDGKLSELRSLLRDRVANPTTDRNGRPNRKLLVFTTFKDTAEYVYRELQTLVDELGCRMAMVAGDMTHTTVGRNEFQAILARFAPRGHGRQEVTETELDLLIATDCVSEGQNLQDCDTVVNYDIHWNPVRLIQRFGRIDRIGSRSRTVRMINFWPTRRMEEYLRLEARVQARMALADVTATGDADPLSEATADAQRDVGFRDRQLKRLLLEIPDLDELADSPAMSDFTLDHFFTQLIRYLERNREALESAPLGIHSVTPAGAGAARQGVVFVLRHRTTNVRKGERVASPLHPFYLAYVKDNGEVRYGCASARQTLELMESVTEGITKPLTPLCDQFHAATANGQNMTHYNSLLEAAMGQFRKAHLRTQVSSLGLGAGRGLRLSSASPPRDPMDDYELITWLILADSGASE